MIFSNVVLIFNSKITCNFLNNFLITCFSIKQCTLYVGEKPICNVTTMGYSPFHHTQYICHYIPFITYTQFTDSYKVLLVCIYISLFFISMYIILTIPLIYVYLYYYIYICISLYSTFPL